MIGSFHQWHDLPGWENAVLEHFKHVDIMSLNRTVVKRHGETQSPVPQRRNVAFIPMDKSQGLSAAVIVKKEENLERAIRFLAKACPEQCWCVDSSTSCTQCMRREWQFYDH